MSSNGTGSLWRKFSREPPPPAPPQVPTTRPRPASDCHISVQIPESSPNNSNTGGNNRSSIRDSFVAGTTKSKVVIKGLKAQLTKELCITGESIWRSFTLAERGQHSARFTLTLLVLLLVVFCIQIGQYDAFIISDSYIAMQCLAPNGDTSQIGPNVILKWMFPKKHHWCTINGGNFETTYLITWGARLGSLLKDQPQRWFTSSILHVSFMHLFSNCTLLLVLGGLMEIEHGWVRVGAGWFISALGGNLLSAVVEDPCTSVVGASGGIYGLVGMYIMEFILDWKVLKRKMLRVLMLICFALVFGISTALESAGTSHLSHAGGLMFGVLCSLAWMPKGFPPPWRLALCIIGTSGLLISTICLYLFFYLAVFPAICCGC